MAQRGESASRQAGVQAGCIADHAVSAAPKAAWPHSSMCRRLAGTALGQRLGCTTTTTTTTARGMQRQRQQAKFWTCQQAGWSGICLEWHLQHQLAQATAGHELALGSWCRAAQGSSGTGHLASMVKLPALYSMLV